MFTISQLPSTGKGLTLFAWGREKYSAAWFSRTGTSWGAGVNHTWPSLCLSHQLKGVWRTERARAEGERRLWCAQLCALCWALLSYRIFGWYDELHLQMRQTSREAQQVFQGHTASSKQQRQTVSPAPSRLLGQLITQECADIWRYPALPTS